MSNVLSTRKFQTRIAWFALVFLTMHIFLAVYFTVSPQDNDALGIGTFYRRVVLLGPFFSKERIMVSPHMHISFRYDGVWTSAFDYGHESFLAYHRSPWQFAHLKQNDYQRQLVRAAYKVSQDVTFLEYKDTDEFRRFHAYTMDKLAPKKKIDSVRIVYVLKTFSKTSGAPAIDTVWRLTYNPFDIAAHR